MYSIIATIFIANVIVSTIVTLIALAFALHTHLKGRRVSKFNPWGLFFNCLLGAGKGKKIAGYGLIGTLAAAIIWVDLTLFCGKATIMSFVIFALINILTGAVFAIIFIKEILANYEKVFNS